jgi:hypothetical protein
VELPEGWTEQDLIKLDESFKKDKFRHIDGQVNHSATALHQRAVNDLAHKAMNNGHSTQQH